jgi:hypothetical protein
VLHDGGAVTSTESSHTARAYNPDRVAMSSIPLPLVIVIIAVGAASSTLKRLGKPFLSLLAIECYSRLGKAVDFL